MIPDPEPPNPVDEALAELAGLDLSLVRHVHAQALATTDPDQINGLSRTYARIARSLRQTLALKAKLARDARDHAPRQSARAREIPAPDQAYDVADAVAKVVWAEHEHEPAEREKVLDELGEYLTDLVDGGAFDGQELTDALVHHLCEDLGLSPEVAQGWASLPEPPKDHQVWWDLTRLGPS